MNNKPSIPVKRSSAQIVEFRSCIREVKQCDVDRVRAVVGENTHVAPPHIRMGNACTVKLMDSPCKSVSLMIEFN